MKANGNVHGGFRAWEPDDEDKGLLKDQRLVVPFVGAGLSQAAGLPGSSELKDHLIRCFNLEREWTKEPLQVVADFISTQGLDETRAMRQTVADFFESALNGLEEGGADREIAEMLVQIPSRLILTLNYDLLLEETAKYVLPSVKVSSLYNPTEFSFADDRAGDNKVDDLTIVHLHGSVKDPTSIVLDHAGYRGRADEIVGQLFQTLMENKLLCMFGTALDEAEIVVKFLRLGRRAGTHLIFGDSDTAESLKQRGIAPTRHHLKVTELPDREAIFGLTRFLVRPVPNLTVKPPEPVDVESVSVLEAGYLELSLRSFGNSNQSEEIAQLIAAGRRGPWIESGEFEAEKRLASERRTAIIGVPGSGKTQLLSKAATFVVAPREACFIRLGHVNLLPADPPTTLLRWAKSSLSPITQESLEFGSIHFFLDGLDEVVANLQQATTDRIVALGEAFPQHQFTVSSRPIPAISAFTTAKWPCLEIETGSAWQKKFLDSHDLSLSDILGAEEAPRDLEDLLRVPFFIGAAVRLREKGVATFNSVWDLMTGLVDKALKREEVSDYLPFSSEDARKWLRDAALAMRLAGREDSNIDQLDSARASAPAWRDDLIQALANRSMLRESDNQIAFYHRVIGEFLAAEALEDVKPSSEVLQAVAPKLESGRSGLAPHWTMPASLLMSVSAPWRAAIKKRDQLIWASSVPASAPLEERLEAATLLWSTYCRWNIWIWRRERTGFVKDGTALSNLLRSGGLEDLVEAIFTAVEDPSPQIQSNAVVVLAGARLPGAAEIIERVLRDDQRDSVVRRQAAVCAEDLELHDLAGLLKDIALSTDDWAEAETCGAVALDLTSDDDIGSVASEMAADPMTSILTLPHVRERLSPEEAISVLRAQFESPEVDAPFSSEKQFFRDAVDAAKNMDKSIAFDAIFVAASWGIREGKILQVISDYPDAAIKAVKRVTDDPENDGQWSAFLLLEDFSSSELETAGFDETTVEWKRRQESRVPVPEPVVPAGEDFEPHTNGRSDPPTLAEVLEWDRDRADRIIQDHPHHFVSEVGELGPDQREDLRKRVIGWLKPEPFGDAFEVVERKESGTTYRFEGWAHSWFWFGPAFDLALDPERWAQMALVGVAYDEQHKWLRRQATEESQDCLVRVHRSGDARDWEDALDSSPHQLSDPIVEAIEEDLLKFEDQPNYEIEKIMRRLREEKREDVLVRLTDQENLASYAFEQLAHLGQPEALGEKFDELEVILRNKSPLDEESVPWIGGANGPEWLPRLFGCLRIILENQSVREIPRRRIRKKRVGRWHEDTGRGLDQSMNVVLGRIQGIGGEAAADGLEDLIENGPAEARWLRFRLEQIEGELLTEESLKNSSRAAKQLGMPSLS